MSARFDVDVRPRIGEKVDHDLRRIDIVDLLDAIEDSGTPVQADRTLAYLRKALRWHATRDDTFVVPIVPGMARTKPKERARTRILDDGNPRPLCSTRCDRQRCAEMLSGLRARHCS